MTETTIVNVATVVRAVLVSGILLAIPHVTRKGLLFGSYVGEEFADGNAARRLLRQWNRSCVVLAFVAMGVGLGISLLGSPMAGNLTCLAIVVLAGPALYFRFYGVARRMAPAEAARQAATAAAPLLGSETRGETLARLALGICLLAGLATVGYAALRYGDLPDPMPTHFSSPGVADQWTDKSLAVVMLLPAMNLVISPFVAVFALLTARAKRSVRAGSGGRSIEAQNAFRACIANLLSGTALFTGALLTYISVQVIRIGLSESRSMAIGILVISLAMLIFMLGYLVRIIVKYGQGGALLEQGSAEAHLTNGLADNANWVWGVFYVNRDDPSIIVEKRFGIGYTFNYGNRKAILILATFVILMFGLVALTLIVVFD